MYFGMQKINQKNTWDLTLIDHLCDIVKIDEGNDAKTNFQKVIIVYSNEIIRILKIYIIDSNQIIV